MGKTLYQNKNGTLEPISWMPFVSTTQAELDARPDVYPEGTIVHVIDGEEESLKLTEVNLPFTPPNDGLLICHMENGASGTARLTVNNGSHNINIDSTGARVSMTVPVFKGAQVTRTTSGTVYNPKYFFFGIQ